MTSATSLRIDQRAPQPIEVVEPQGADPGGRTDGGDHKRVKAGRLPGRDPVSAELQGRDDDEQDERAQRVHNSNARRSAALCRRIIAMRPRFRFSGAS